MKCPVTAKDLYCHHFQDEARRTVDNTDRRWRAEHPLFTASTPQKTPLPWLETFQQPRKHGRGDNDTERLFLLFPHVLTWRHSVYTLEHGGEGSGI